MLILKLNATTSSSRVISEAFLYHFEDTNVGVQYEFIFFVYRMSIESTCFEKKGKSNQQKC